MNTRPDNHDEDAGPPSSDELLAAEYVLGVLDAPQRRAAQARLTADPGFADLVMAWEQRFAGWLLRIEPVPAPPHAWPRIRTRLGWPPVADSERGLWQSVSFWRGATAAAMAIAAAVVVFVTRMPESMQTPRPTPIVIQPAPVEVAKPVTVLARDDGSAGWLASIDAGNGKLLMVPVPAPVAAPGRAHELWLIAAGEAPQSLGFVSSEKAHTVTVPGALRRALAAGSTLAITLEPEAGMPHAAPSGPIMAKGGITQI